jgi:hypothetical protein
VAKNRIFSIDFWRIGEKRLDSNMGLGDPGKAKMTQIWSQGYSEMFFARELHGNL